MEKQIFRYLKQNLYADPEAFSRRFVFRSCYGENAREMFPVLLEAYGRVTKRVTINSYGERPQLEQFAESLSYINTHDVFEITLFERGRWPTSSLKPSGYIFLPVRSVEKVAGTVDNFFVASNTSIIKFHRDFVRISIFDREKNTVNAEEQH